MLLALILGFFAIPSRQKTPNPWQSDEIACSRAGSFPVEAWSVNGIKIGSSTLSDVQARFGKATAFRPFKDETPSKALCYRLRDERIVVFESGPLAAPGRVSSISILARAFVPFAAQCASAETKDVTVAPPGALPGASRGAFEKLVPLEPCSKNASKTAWNFESRSLESDTLSGLQAHFDHDRLQWWYVYRASEAVSTKRHN